MVKRRKIMAIENNELCNKHQIPYKKFSSGEFTLKSCPKCAEEIEQQQKKYQEKKQQQLLQERLFKSNIPLRYKNAKVDNYEIKNEKQRKAIKDILWFIDNYRISTGIILIGKTGTGKTHLACAILKTIIEKDNISGKFIDFAKLMRIIKESWNKDSEKSETEILYKYCHQLDILVIDEIGIQFGSNTEKLYLTEIINDRYNSLKPTILIANMTIPELTNLMGERIIDRFKENGRVLVFDWDSYRGRK